MSRQGLRFLVIATVSLALASGCSASAPSQTARDSSRAAREEPPTSSSDELCNDLLDAILAAPHPPGPVSGDGINIGSGDTFFTGLPGRRWGENVEYYDDSFHMKVGIYTLDSHPPKVSVTRGHATGGAVFAPTGEGLPGPLPTDLSFPTAGCWKVEARGTTGFASIEVNVQAPMPSSGN
jgi:hypothetical protein